MLRTLFRFASPSPAVSPSAVCDVIIPAFNRPDRLRDLLSSLKANTNRALLGRVWIGDDCSDSFSRDAFKRLAAESTLPVEIIRHEKNLGFGGNCSELFHRVERPYCIVLNTDVQLPAFWLERMLAPFQHDATVALATPFSTDAANHTLRLKPGQSWIEADRLLASRKPLFPDDCTAIGFCLGLNVVKLREAGQFHFDHAFGRGYGEDTDLHYRAIAAGFRSVIVDNLLVHHASGSSFSTLPDYKAVREHGQSSFRFKWADTHARAYAEFEKRKTLDSVTDPETREFRFKSPKAHLDVLFVLPSTHLRYGGVWFVCKLVESLNASGLRAAAYVKDKANLIADTSAYGFRVFQDPADLRERVSSVGCVVSTSDLTIRTALALSKEFHCTEALFLQCMEVAFRSGISIDTFLQYRRIPNVVTVSEALREYIRIIHPGVNVTTLPIGPDPLVFYPRDLERVPKSVAIAINDIPEKAFTHALEFALMLWARGFRLTFFGWDQHKYPVSENIGEVLKDTSRDALATLFSRTEFIIDESYLEGLGLVPLEAAFCGCVPILSSKGAPEYFLRDGENCIRIPGYLGLASLLDSIASLTPGRIAALRRNCLKLRTTRGLPQGLESARSAFASLSGHAETAPFAGLTDYAFTPVH